MQVSIWAPAHYLAHSLYTLLSKRTNELLILKGKEFKLPTWNARHSSQIQVFPADYSPRSKHGGSCAPAALLLSTTAQARGQEHRLLAMSRWCHRLTTGWEGNRVQGSHRKGAWRRGGTREQLGNTDSAWGGRKAWKRTGSPGAKGFNLPFTYAACLLPCLSSFSIFLVFILATACSSTRAWPLSCRAGNGRGRDGGQGRKRPPSMQKGRQKGNKRLKLLPAVATHTGHFKVNL